MLYCAANIALCCLEVLVHTDKDVIPDNYVWSYAELRADPEVFDGLWDIHSLDQTRWYGKSWIDSRRSLGIMVPSVIVPNTGVDFNILLNPTHDAYSEVVWKRGGPFAFDRRLFFKKTSAF